MGIKKSPSCQMLIRLWDVDNQDWDVLQVEVPGRPKSGPSDEYLEVLDSKVSPDQDGNFISDSYSEEELDAVHTFAVARLSIDLWEYAIGKKINWYWSKENIHSRLKIELNKEIDGARFEDTQHALWFGTYGPTLMDTCKSVDIVSHETTHAIIESIRFDLHKSPELEVCALKEALADCTPIFLLAKSSTILNSIFDGSGIALKHRNLLSEFALGYGENKNVGIRSATNIFYDSSDPYKYGSVLINNLYNQVINTFNNTENYMEYIDSLNSILSMALRPIITMKKISINDYLNCLHKG